MFAAPLRCALSPYPQARQTKEAPRTSGRSASAAAAVAGRERAPERRGEPALREPLVGDHGLPTPKRPGVEFLIPGAGFVDVLPDPVEILEGTYRTGQSAEQVNTRLLPGLKSGGSDAWEIL